MIISGEELTTEIIQALCNDLQTGIAMALNLTSDDVDVTNIFLGSIVAEFAIYTESIESGDTLIVTLKRIVEAGESTVLVNLGASTVVIPPENVVVSREYWGTVAIAVPASVGGAVFITFIIVAVLLARRKRGVKVAAETIVPQVQLRSSGGDEEKAKAVQQLIAESSKEVKLSTPKPAAIMSPRKQSFRKYKSSAQEERPAEEEDEEGGHVELTSPTVHQRRRERVLEQGEGGGRASKPSSHRESRGASGNEESSDEKKEKGPEDGEEGAPSPHKRRRRKKKARPVDRQSSSRKPELPPLRPLGSIHGSRLPPTDV